MALVLAFSRASDSASRSRRRRCLCALTFLVSYSFFVANYDTLSSGDNLPSRAVPQALINGDGFDLSRVIPDRLKAHYSLVENGPSLQSAFPIGTGLLATPYYTIARVLSDSGAEIESPMARRFEKHCAALLCSFGVLLLFLSGFGGESATPKAAILALALTTATPVLTSLSQGLWSQTGEFFFLALSVFLISRLRGAAVLEIASGLALGAAYLCRPTAVLLTPVVLCFTKRGWRSIGFFLSGLFVGGLASSGLNYLLSGNLLGSYMHLNAVQKVWSAQGYFQRLAGCLLSPSRGLSWFFPAFLVALLVLFVNWRRLDRPLAKVTLASFSVAFVLCALTAGYRNWWGGYSIGPRLLAELALPSIMACSAALTIAGRKTRALLVCLLLAQSVTHLSLYASQRAKDWNGIVDVDRESNALFSVRNSVLAAAFVSNWEYRAESTDYFLPEKARFSLEEWIDIDLKPVANADYSSWETRQAENARWHLYLPRLNPESFALSNRTGFRFLPPRALNMVQLCAGRSATVHLPGEFRLRRIALVLSWRGNAEPRGPVGRITLIRSSGGNEEREVRLGHEVFDPATALAAPAHNLVAGRWNDFDELARTVFSIRRRAAFDSALFEGPPPGEEGCLHLLAVSIQ